MVKPVYFEVTLDCMADCVFCSQKPVSRPIKETYNSIETFKKVLDNSEGAELVMLTGGSPMMHPQIVEMVKIAKDRGLEVSMQTNGILLPHFAKQLKKAGLSSVYLSIHSMDRELEKKMVGIDCLNQKIAGFQAALDAGLVVFPVIVINKLNYKVLPETVKKLHERFNLKHIVLNFIDPTGKARRNKDVVPKYSDVDYWLALAAKYLIAHKISFRVERVPLCYMAEFATYSTEARRMATREKQYTYRRGVQAEFYDDDYWKSEYVRGEACKHCTWRKVCPGIPVRYAEIYGTDELFPLFFSLDSLLKKLDKD